MTAGLLLAAAALAAPPHRLAVVEVAGARAVPPAFTALLEAALLRSEAVTLVERGELRRVLAERALTLAAGADALAAAGALVAADALLLLEAGDPGRERVTPVRVRLVDARDGVKLQDVVVAPGDGTKLDETAGFVAGRVARRLGLAAAGGARTLVGVIGFTSEEVSRRWDWLSGSLSAGIEGRLGEVPGVVLLERERLHPLAEERVLTAGLPERLRTSAVLVDGSYGIALEGGRADVLLVLRGRRGGETVFEARLPGAVDDVASLARRAAEEVRARLELAAPARAMDADVEVAALLREAEACTRVRACDRALRLVEGAHALAPDRVDVRLRLVLAGRDAFLRVHETPLARTDRAGYFREILPICFRTLGVAERIVANDLPHGLYAGQARSAWVHRPGSWFVDGLFDVFAYGNLHLGPAQADPETGQEVRSRVRRLFARYREVVKGKDDVLYGSILSQASKDFAWHCESAEEAIRFCRGVREETAALLERVACPECATGLDCGGSAYDFEAAPWGGDRARWGPLYRAFLDDLIRDENPLLRLSGLRSSARWERGSPRSVEQARAGLDLLLDRLVVSMPADAVAPWLAPWAEELLELAWGRAGAAGEDARARHHREKLLEARLRLRAHPPEAASGGSTGPARYRLERVADLAPLAPAEARGLVAGEGLLAVVTARPAGPGRVRWGLVRLDANTRRPLPVVELDRDVEEVRESAATLDSGRGPATAVAGATVWVGLPGAGLAAFPEKGPARLLTEEDGLPDRRVRALEAVDGRLFALVGDAFTDSGLMEVDPASGRARLLASSRARERRGPLDGRFLQFLCADRERRALVLGVEGGPGGPRSALLVLDVRSGTVEPLADDAFAALRRTLLGERGQVSARRTAGTALITSFPFVYSIDLSTRRIAPLLRSSQLAAQVETPWLARARWPRAECLWRDRLVCREGATLLCFRPDRAEPELPLDALGPVRAPGGPLRDVAPDGDGLLLLEPAGLHRLSSPP